MPQESWHPGKGAKPDPIQLREVPNYVICKTTRTLESLNNRGTKMSLFLDELWLIVNNSANFPTERFRRLAEKGRVWITDFKQLLALWVKVQMINFFSWIIWTPFFLLGKLMFLRSKNLLFCFSSFFSSLFLLYFIGVDISVKHVFHSCNNTTNNIWGALRNLVPTSVKIKLHHGCFSRFLNCTKSTESRKT